MVSSRKYTKKYRDRLHEQGYVKTELWVPPEYRVYLKRLALCLRQGIVPTIPRTKEECEKMERTTDTLFGELSSYAKEHGGISFKQVETDGETAAIISDVEGIDEIPAAIVVNTQEILVSSEIININKIPEEKRGKLAVFLLSLNSKLPLSNIAISNHAICVQGNLSRNAPIESVIEDIIVLAHNTVEVMGAILEFVDENTVPNAA